MKKQELQTVQETAPAITGEIISSLVLNGDISKLSQVQKVEYHNHLCKNLGLNPLTQPFQILKLNGKETLYAAKNATEQLRKIYGISLVSLEGKQLEGLYIVTVTLKDQTNRQDISTAAVNISGLKGDSLANAIMKAETKAKRRGTLSICGLGMLDETEIETIPGAEKANFHNPVSEISLTKTDRNYTAEADNCNTLAELQTWYKNLSKEEQSGPAKGVTKQRKEYLMKVEQLEKEMKEAETQDAEEIATSPFDKNNYRNETAAKLFEPVENEG